MRKLWVVLPLAGIILTGCGKGKNTGPAAANSNKGKPVAGNSDKAKPATDQSYTIKIKVFPDVNKTVTVRTTEKTTGKTKMTAGGQGKDSNENGSKETVYTETILEAGDKMPKKFKRAYEKAVETKNGMEKTESYQGKTVVFTLKGDHYQGSVEGGGALPLPDLTKLTKDAEEIGRNEQALLPAKPVKVGDTWTFDPRQIGPKEFGGPGVDMAASKGMAKLGQVYSKDGKQYGTIEFHLLLVLKEMAGLKLEKPARFSIIGKLDTPIDGSSTARKMSGKGKMEMKGSAEQGGKKVMEMDTTINADLTEEVSAEK